MDLIYGLPYQTPESFSATIDQVLEIGPDRLAVYSYANVPWMKKHQNVLEPHLPDEADEVRDLPDGARRASPRPASSTSAWTTSPGPTTSSRGPGATARSTATSRATRPRPGTDLLGFGMSAIGSVGRPLRPEPPRARRVPRGRRGRRARATFRGFRLSADDRLRRDRDREPPVPRRRRQGGDRGALRHPLRRALRRRARELRALRGRRSRRARRPERSARPPSAASSCATSRCPSTRISAARPEKPVFSGLCSGARGSRLAHRRPRGAEESFKAARLDDEDARFFSAARRAGDPGRGSGLSLPALLGPRRHPRPAGASAQGDRRRRSRSAARRPRASSTRSIGGGSPDPPPDRGPGARVSSGSCARDGPTSSVRAAMNCSAPLVEDVVRELAASGVDRFLAPPALSPVLADDDQGRARARAAMPSRASRPARAVPEIGSWPTHPALRRRPTPSRSGRSSRGSRTPARRPCTCSSRRTRFRRSS